MHQKLTDLLYGVALRETAGPMDIAVQGLTADSRQVAKGSLFVAAKGTRSNGHDFIAQAVASGALAVVCEYLPEVLESGATYVVVEESREALGIIAGNYYDNPSHKLKLLGVTGTNGKTTVATLLYRLYRAMGFQVGLLSTVENRIGEQVLSATHTTPDSVALQGLLAQMVEAGCSHVFMEVSSHAADQRRIAGLDFDVAVFTNLSQDHLDYHGDMKSYIAAKKRFFDGLGSHAQALVNSDDKRGLVMLQNTRAAKHSYGLQGAPDFQAKILENGFEGLHLRIDQSELHSLLLGEFNAYNILAVYAASVLLGQEPSEILQALSGLRAPEGRFDYLLSQRDRIVGIVDYAHTPDALEQVLKTIRHIRTGSERLIAVVGCGGDRDRGKRPEMARIACQLSDQVILTADNPRSEDPMQIIGEMQAGVGITCQPKTLTQPDRREAIRTACALAAPGDIILVAGKGHEKYQEIAGVRHPFDDRAILLETLEKLGR
jgi:UDP-N-acetylmuramoyl-L-alanyl-D-glutamate--2,6-diaminopimelate ligase